MFMAKSVAVKDFPQSISVKAFAANDCSTEGHPCPSFRRHPSEYSMAITQPKRTIICTQRDGRIHILEAVRFCRWVAKMAQAVLEDFFCVGRWNTFSLRSSPWYPWATAKVSWVMATFKAYDLIL